MNQTRRHLLIGGTLACICAAAGMPLAALGASSDLPSPRPVDSGPGKKFDAQGRAQAFPGNTVICPISASNPAFAVLHAAYEALYEEVASERLAKLPASSFHMTVFDGALDARRQPGDWPHRLPLDASMDECNQRVGDALRKLAVEIKTPIRMKIDPADVPGVSTLVYLTPVDAQEEQRLRRLREELTLATGIRHQGAESYRFHTSFAYYIHPFSCDELVAYQVAYRRMVRRLSRTLAVIELGAPEYCLFDDMTAFHSQFALGHR